MRKEDPNYNPYDHLHAIAEQNVYLIQQLVKLGNSISKLRKDVDFLKHEMRHHQHTFNKQFTPREEQELRELIEGFVDDI